jgi:hypothetical protein
VTGQPINFALIAAPILFALVWVLFAERIVLS